MAVKRKRAVKKTAVKRKRAVKKTAPSVPTVRISTLEHCYISSPKLAELFGVGADMVRRYVNDYGMPRVGNGKYLLRDCVRWYIDRLRMEAGGDTGDVAAEKLKLVRAQRHRVELDNKRVRGELIAHEEVAESMNAMSSLYSSQLDGLAARMASVLSGISDPAEVQRVLFDECRAIRASTAAAAIALAADYDGSGDSDTAETTERRAVG